MAMSVCMCVCVCQQYHKTIFILNTIDVALHLFNSIHIFLNEMLNATDNFKILFQGLLQKSGES